MQLILVGIVIFFPQTVTIFLDKEKVLDLDKASQQIQEMGGGRTKPAAQEAQTVDPLMPSKPAAEEDPMEAVKRALDQDKTKK